VFTAFATGAGGSLFRIIVGSFANLVPPKVALGDAV
jgi:hypothetical protein